MPVDVTQNDNGKHTGVMFCSHIPPVVRGFMLRRAENAGSRDDAHLFGSCQTKDALAGTGRGTDAVYMN
jgi:hypothetical protein